MFSAKFVRTASGEFDLSASTPIPQVSTLQLSHTHSGNNNEYKLQWNNDNIISLNYDRVRWKMIRLITDLCYIFSALVHLL